MKNKTYIRKHISTTAITLTITAVLMLTQLPLIHQTRAVCNPPDSDPCEIEARISPSEPSAIPVGEYQTFSADSESKHEITETSWVWEGEDKSGKDVSLSWKTPGTKEIKMTSTCEHGGTDTASVSVTVVNVRLEKISGLRSPALADAGRICLNAQDEYKKAKFKATVEPEGTTAKVSSTGYGANVNVSGVGSGVDTNNLEDGDKIWVEEAGETGTYEITLEHKDCSDSKATYSEEIFKVVLVTGSPDCSPGTTGNGTALPTMVKQEANAGGIQHAANQDIRRYAWLETEPAGKYNAYAKAKLKVSEEFNDRADTYGLRIFNDELQRTGGLTFSIKWGLIKFNLPPVTDEQDMSIFKGEARIKGPNDSSFSRAPTAQSSLKTSDLAPLEWTQKKSITTTVDKTTFTNHYKVGDDTSRAEAHSQASVSGGYEGKDLLHDSEGTVTISHSVKIEAVSDYELTEAVNP